jgi:hypothetical protein
MESAREIQRRERAERRASFFAIVISFVLMIVSGYGCAETSEHRTHVETVTSESPETPNGDTPQYRTERVTEESHKTEDNHGCSGILSCAFDTIGEVLAFPFKAIGYAFQAIF